MSARNRVSTPAPRHAQPASQASSPAAQPVSQASSPAAALTHPTLVPGLLGSLLNLAFIIGVGLKVKSVEYDFNFLLPSATRDISYGSFLFAACPRCALISKHARTETHGFCAIANLLDKSSYQSWLVWATVPSVQGIRCGLDGNGDYPFLAKVFIVLMVVTLLHDVVVLVLVIRSALRFDMVNALRVTLQYIAKYLLLWGLANSYFLCYNYLFGSIHRLLVCTLIIMLFILRLCAVIGLVVTIFVDGKDVFWGLPMFSALSGFEFFSGFAPVAFSAMFLYSPFFIAASNLGLSVVFSVFGMHGLLIFFAISFPPIIKFVVNVFLIAQFIDLGFAELLLLETLRHKTGLANMMSICLQGLLARRGGQSGGGEAAFGEHRAKEIKGQVYVWKDSFLGLEPGGSKVCSQQYMEENLCHVHVQGFTMFAWRAFFGNLFSFSSGRSSFYKHFTGNEFVEGSGPMWLAANVWGAFACALPSLKFRCTLDDLAVYSMRADPKLQDTAWYTDRDIPAHWIGIAGSCYHALRLIRSGYFRELLRAPARAASKLLLGSAWIVAAFAWPLLIDEWNSVSAFAVLLYL